MANGVLAGLFGGQSPYPVSPQMRQGLLGDAGRSAGIALLANAMNPNIGQGLAAALAAGRQAYQGGAEQAYRVGRQEEQDRAYREHQQARAEAAKALAESRRAEAQAGAEEAEAQAERVDEALAALRERDPDAAQRMDIAIKLFGIGGLPASMAALLEPPEPEPDMTPYQREQVRLAEERLNLQRQRAGQRTGEPEPTEPGGLSETTRRQLAMAEYNAALEQHEALWEATKKSPAYRDLEGTTTMAPPPPPDLAPFLDKYGLSPERAAPEASPEAGTDQQVAWVLSSLPPELANRPGLAEQVAKDLAGGATPEQILEQIQAVLAGGQ